MLTLNLGSSKLSSTSTGEHAERSASRSRCLKAQDVVFTSVFVCLSVTGVSTATFEDLGCLCFSACVFDEKVLMSTLFEILCFKELIAVCSIFLNQLASEPSFYKSLCAY